jgi:hypothetical protein
MHNFIVAIINDSYMFWLYSSHHQPVYMRSIKGNHIPEVYTWLKTIRGGYLDLRYKGI